MLVNSQTLRTLYVGFNSLFQSAFTSVQSEYSRIATTVPSTTAENEYGWLKDIPNFREWLGDRVVNSVSDDGYRVKNRHFELTVGVNRNNIEDDNIGVYSPLFTNLGQKAAEFPDTLVFDLLSRAWEVECFDRQPFFDTDHPVLDEHGKPITVSNSGGGGGTPWFLLDVRHAIKPLIFQERKKFNNLVRKDRETDDNVFDKNEFVYGNDGRGNVGFGFWQMAYGSRQPLTAENYEAARAALGTMKGDYGRKLALKGTLLVVPQTLEGAGRRLLINDTLPQGGTNEWKGSAELMVSAWL